MPNINQPQQNKPIEKPEEIKKPEVLEILERKSHRRPKSLSVSESKFEKAKTIELTSPTELAEAIEAYKENKEKTDKLIAESEKLGLKINKQNPEFRKLQKSKTELVKNIRGLGNYLKNPELGVKPEELELVNQAKGFLADADWSNLVNLSKPVWQRPLFSPETRAKIGKAGETIGTFGLGFMSLLLFLFLHQLDIVKRASKSKF